MTIATLEQNDAPAVPRKASHDVNETAAIIGIGRNSVYKLLESGSLRRVDLPGIRRTLITRESIDELLAK